MRLSFQPRETSALLTEGGDYELHRRDMPWISDLREELKVLRRALEIAEIGMAAALATIREGVRECEVAARRHE